MNEIYQRALEAYESARQMALDFNQSAAAREHWENRKKVAEGIIHEAFDLE